jgi:hypothetical protein
MSKFKRLTQSHGLFYYIPLLFITFLVTCAAKQDGQVLINEVLAKNSGEWRDDDGDTSDWIELYNPTSHKINLGGYTLTDDSANPGQWTFPDVTISPKQYLLVWASGKNRRDRRELHTNFKLNGDGESLYLVHPSGQIVDSLTFTVQKTNVSYGRCLRKNAVDCRYFPVPSPNQPNPEQGYLGFVKPPTATVADGIYSQAVTVTFETPTDAAEIRYTLDGSTPTHHHSIKYDTPLTFNRTTIVRASAFKKDYLPSPTMTRTYLIGVKHTLPVVSIVTDPENLWGSDGIYDNSTWSGQAWERPASAAFLDTDGIVKTTFNTGLRIHGGASRQRAEKQSFRFYFRRRYGQTKLDASLFPSAPDIATLRRIVLRGGYNDSWSHQTAAFWNIATYVRDQLVRDLHLDMGRVAAHGDFVALYLNGEYWGLYNICERISGDFLSRYLGDGEWDIIKDDQAREGDSMAWERFKAWYRSVDLSLLANYRLIGQMMDIENFTDYFIINTWAHNYDWPHHNWYAARKRDDENARWFFLVWDAEYAFGGGREPFQAHPNTLVQASSPNGSLGLLFNKMLENDEYRAYFTKRFEEHSAGTLQPDSVLKVLEKRLAQVRPEVSAEAQRWRPIKEMADWEEAADHLRDFIAQRDAHFRRHVESMPEWLRYQSYPRWHRRFPERR